MKSIRTVFSMLSALFMGMVLFGSSGAAAQSVKPTPDQILDWAERQYASLFPRGSQTQTLNDSRGAISYRYYPSTANYLGIQGDNILGIGAFTGGQLTPLGTIDAIKCQVLPASCGKLYIHWQEIATPSRGCAIRQFEGRVYCGANVFTGSDWQAVSVAPPSLSSLPTGLEYYTQSSNRDFTIYKETTGGTTLRMSNDGGRFGWDGGATAVRALSGNRHFQITRDGGVTWSNLTTYVIGPDQPGGGSRIVESLAYAYGAIYAAIRQTQPATGIDRRYLLASPNGGVTWFESGETGRLTSWVFIGTTSGFISTENGTFSLRFANGVILDRLAFDGGASGAGLSLRPVGAARDTLFAIEPFVGLWLFDSALGKFYRPTPSWSGVSYFNYIDFGINGYIAVGRGSTSYITAYPLDRKETPQ